jgi:hypothetical protein
MNSPNKPGIRQRCSKYKVSHVCFMDGGCYCIAKPNQIPDTHGIEFKKWYQYTYTAGN